MRCRGRQETVTIEKLVSGGDGLARLSDGRVVFVPRVLPGEQVQIEITLNKKDYAKGRVLTILEASSARVEPKCPYYEVCGGCDLQHASDTQQQRIKEEILFEVFARTAALDLSEMGRRYAFFSGKMWEYRTRAKFHVDQRTGAVGYLGRGSNEVVDIAVCPILDPRLQKLLSKGKDQLKRASSASAKKNNPSLREVHTVVGDTGAAVADQRIVQTINPERASAVSFSIDAEVFFQSNQQMLELLLDDLFWNISPGREAMDLFSGVGTFAAFLQERFSKVTAVERDVRCRSFAEEHLDPQKVRWFDDAVENWIQGRGAFDMDLIVVDPPRTGLPEPVIDIMLSWRPKRVIYVSCNPVTLARDTAIIRSRGYSMELLHAYDFYPQTSHMEAAAVFSRAPVL